MAFFLAVFGRVALAFWVKMWLIVWATQSMQRMKRVISLLNKTKFFLVLLRVGAACLLLNSKLPAQTILVPTNATWNYLDTGEDLGPSLWRALTFDDSGWLSGPAELGYGLTPEEHPVVTTVSYGPDPTNKFITTYFRHSFVVTNLAAISNLTLTLQSLNGGVVYLNYFEAYRDLMPNGPVAANTLALPSEPPEEGESPYLARTISRDLLNEGTNVIAVEIHLSAVTNANMSFALKLTARYGDPIPTVPSLKRGPYLQIGTPTSITVRWRTDLATDSRVQYGLDPTNLTESASDDEVTGEHIVELADLLPDTKYYYAVGANGTNFAAGAEYFFVTGPATSRPTRIWVIGDSGTATIPGGNSEGVRDAYYSFAKTRYTDLWLMLGDNAYYEGTDAQYQTAVFNTYPEMLRQTCVWPTIGNHETYDPYADGHIAYSDIFTLPTRGEAGGMPSGTEHYYSFDYGNIHFVCLDSEMSDTQTNGPMVTWLKNDLAANTKDWLIAFWHSPPYSHGSHNSDSPSEWNLVAMRENIVPVLESYGVDLVLCGHSHCYERSFLLDGHYGNSSTLVPSMIKDSGSGRPSDTGAYLKSIIGPTPHQGAVYVVNGSSGWATDGTMDHPAMYKSLLRTGSLVLDVNGGRLDAKFLRETGAIDDFFTIMKGMPPEALRLASFYMGTNMISTKWKSVTGRTYRLQQSDSLATNSWTDVSSNVTATGATTTWTCPIPLNSSHGFYRVVEIK